MGHKISSSACEGTAMRRLLVHHNVVDNLDDCWLFLTIFVGTRERTTGVRRWRDVLHADSN